jgi:hypothetical protein
MRNLLKTLTQKPVAVFTAVLVGAAMVVVPTAMATSYTGTYTGNGKPQFNIYGNVSGIGEEKNFLRIGAKGSTPTAFTDSREVCSGEADLFVYVHNGAPEGYNDAKYNGSGIAKDTRVKVQLPASYNKNHTLSSTISASNAASVSDTTKLTCGSHEVSVKYVANSAYAWTEQGGSMKLNESVVSSGALIGTDKLDGKVPGCWEYRVWIKLTVKVEKKVVPEVKPSTGICKDLVLVKSEGRRVQASVVGEVSNATVTGYRIDFGDGTVVNERSASHTYANDQRYTVVGSVKIKYADGTEKWVSSSDCEESVKYVTPEQPEKPEKPVVEKPKTVLPELPKTGAAGLLLSAGGMGALGAFGHRFATVRRLKK